MKKSEERYLQFPLYLLRSLLKSKESTLNDILDVGIYNYGKKLNYSKRTVARQVIYDLYKDKLSGQLYQAITNLDSDIIGKDVDYKGFLNNGEFSASEEIEELENQFTSNSKLYSISIVHYKLQQAKNFLGVTGGSTDYTAHAADRVFKYMPDKDPQPMVSKALIFNFRDNEKSEFELLQLAAFIGIRSIIGVRQYFKTNKSLIISRMLGYVSHKHYPKKMPVDLARIKEKYEKRYHYERLIQELELNWGLLTYSGHSRGLYVAIQDKISREGLIMAAENKKQKRRIATLQAEKRAAEAKILQQLNKEQHLNKGEQPNKESAPKSQHQVSIDASLNAAIVHHQAQQ